MDIREEFEKLEDVKQGLRHCHYNESTNDYHADVAHEETHEWHAQFVNGAWYAFQEQQKKIDEFRSQLRTVLDEYYLTDYYNPDTCRSAELLLLMPSIYTDDELKIEIQELLK